MKMEKLDGEEMKKHVPEEGERLWMYLPIKNKKGKIIDEKLVAHKVIKVKINKRTGEATVKFKILCPEIYPLGQREKKADEIVEMIKPQLVNTIETAVRDSLAKERTPENLEHIKSQIEKTPDTNISVTGKKGCIFLSVGKKKYKL
jgi:RNA-binding protein YhbY